MALNNAQTPDQPSGPRSPGRFTGQVRWQLIICYVLIGGVSVTLVVAFAAATLNLMMMRGSAMAVERQVDLLLAQIDDRSATMAERMSDQAEHRPQEFALRRQRTGPGPGRPPRPIVGNFIRTRCVDEKGATLVQTFPPGTTLEPPPWLEGDSFAGVVYDDADGPGGAAAGHLDLMAFERRSGPRCAIEVMTRQPLDAEMAGLISRALDLEVTVAGRPHGPPGQRPPRWRILNILWGPSGGRVPVALTARDWATGRPVDRFAFFVRPNYATTFEQLRRFGQRESMWVRLLWTLLIAFLVVEILALYLAVRLTRRIVNAVNSLSHAAREIGRGNLEHRIAVRRDDQLGRLARSFNDMAASLGTLMREAQDRERVEEDLRIARQVQESLYPQKLPALRGTELAAAAQPARNVSGDLYDVIDFGHQRLGLLCADVSGKGIPAALLSASLQAIVRSVAQNGATPLPSPGDLVARINTQLCHRIPDNRFITLFWAEYDAVTRRLRTTNAGHCPPLVFHANNGQPRRLERGGPPVGIFPDARYETEEIELDPASLLVLYTDGIPEATNSRGEEFGEERLVALCGGGFSRSPRDLVDAILEARRAWAGEVEQSDDLTLVVLRTGR